MVPRPRVPPVPLKITCRPLTGSSMELRKQNGPRFGTEFAPLCNQRLGALLYLQLEVRGPRSVAAVKERLVRLLPRRRATEIRRVIRAAGPIVFRHLRVWAQRPRALGDCRLRVRFVLR